MGHIQTDVVALKLFGQYPHTGHPVSVRLKIQGNIFKEHNIYVSVAFSHSQWKCFLKKKNYVRTVNQI